MKTTIGWMKQIWDDEEGLGTLEILLIVAVLVAIAIIFRKWIVSWFQKLIGDANSDLKDNSAVTPCAPSPTTSCAP
ncbi:Putative Flagellin, Flp1-like, domain [Paenibacillus sp. yr247]|uniref:Flp1 family type IVb pilin n=1 Tax=Paenibacillus sp. yr247 TaxID=1761880 RepID=UPI0008890D8F|nr:Flp1 family type IVb pilin [Paenibacillus sp. yr247]SDN82162.1 Putative Flagellin, Flp1-like, domain [Paenibacillus sp. yr247]